MKKIYIPFLKAIHAVIFMILIVLAFISPAQNKVTISGFICDEKTKEILINANIYSPKYLIGTTSNEFGFYSLSLPASDSLSIMASYIGYQKKQIVLQRDQADYTIYLSQGVDIEEVRVLGVSKNDVLNLGINRLSIKEVKNLPNLFGEVDIIKTFQYTTGVQSGGEGKSDLFVRGGSPDQNLILLDDVPLYYISHLGGFFSVFNADAIYNIYNRKNPYYYFYDREIIQFVDEGSDGHRLTPELDYTKLYQQSLFSFLPSFSYSFKF